MAFLKRHGISASKGLGQHFLCSSKVVNQIFSRFDGYQGVLEIGPGPGVLTSGLSDRVSQLIALEIDERMISVLKESAPHADVRQVDALQSDLAVVLQELPEPRGVVSNLPYYITGPLVSHIAEARAHWSKAVLMMQKEVAVRIMAPAGSSDRGSLSVYLQALFAITRVIEAPAGAFVPPPKVASTVLQFVPNGAEYPEDFFKFVRAGFKQPRKTLANNLLAIGLTRELVEASGLDERIRPQALTQDEWLNLFNLTLT